MLSSAYRSFNLAVFIGQISLVQLIINNHTSTRRLIRCSSFLAAKDHASTHSPCCCFRTFIRTSSTNCSPKGVAIAPCCHAFCFGCVTRHGSSCGLHPALSNRPPLHCITFHSPPTLGSLCLGYIQRADFSPHLQGD